MTIRETEKLREYFKEELRELNIKDINIYSIRAKYRIDGWNTYAVNIKRENGIQIIVKTDFKERINEYVPVIKVFVLREEKGENKTIYREIKKVEATDNVETAKQIIGIIKDIRDIV